MVLSALTGTVQGRSVINASFTQGDNINWAWQVSSGNVSLNLTGYIIKMTIGFPTNPLVITNSSGSTSSYTISSAAPSSGAFNVIMSTGTTAPFTPGTYNFDVWLNPSASSENQYATGTFTIYQSVTSVP